MISWPILYAKLSIFCNFIQLESYRLLYSDKFVIVVVCESIGRRTGRVW